MNYESGIMNYGILSFIKIFIHDSLFIIRRYKISGNSMSPALADGQYVVGESITYRFRNPGIGDMVVLKNPDNGMNLIKRITKSENESYFVEGDNKNQSRDSRNFGLISKGRIIARIIYR